MKPMILCFLDKLGRFSSILRASQLLSSFLLLAIPESLETPRKGSSSSSPPPPPPKGVLMELRVGSDIEDSFDVREEREVVEALLLLLR